MKDIFHRQKPEILWTLPYIRTWVKNGIKIHHIKNQKFLHNLQLSNLERNLFPFVKIRNDCDYEMNCYSFAPFMNRPSDKLLQYSSNFPSTECHFSWYTHLRVLMKTHSSFCNEETRLKLDYLVKKSLQKWNLFENSKNLQVDIWNSPQSF